MEADLIEALKDGPLAGAGFDWIVIDAEHGPFDLNAIIRQLQAIALDVGSRLYPDHFDLALIRRKARVQPRVQVQPQRGCGIGQRDPVDDLKPALLGQQVYLEIMLQRW